MYRGAAKFNTDLLLRELPRRREAQMAAWFIDSAISPCGALFTMLHIFARVHFRKIMIWLTQINSENFCHSNNEKFGLNQHFLLIFTIEQKFLKICLIQKKLIFLPFVQRNNLTFHIETAWVISLHDAHTPNIFYDANRCTHPSLFALPKQKLEQYVHKSHKLDFFAI